MTTATVAPSVEPMTQPQNLKRRRILGKLLALGGTVEEPDVPNRRLEDAL